MLSAYDLLFCLHIFLHKRRLLLADKLWGVDLTKVIKHQGLCIINLFVFNFKLPRFCLLSSNQCFLFLQAFSFSQQKYWEFLKFLLISSLNLTNFSPLWGGEGRGEVCKTFISKNWKRKTRIANCHPSERKFSQILAIKNEIKKKKKKPFI